MKTRLPPLNPLRTFEAVARLSSVKRAAEELGVTHGAVSHQLRALEDALGSKLFHRGVRKITLTPEGTALLPAASTAFEGIRAAVERMNGCGPKGELTISCVPGLLSFWLIPNLPKFQMLHPDVKLSITSSNDVLSLYDPGPHVKIRYGDGKWPDLWVRHLTDIRLFPVYSPLLHQARPIRSCADMCDHTLIHAGGMLEWNNWLAAMNILHLGSSSQCHCSDAHIAMECAVRGLGVALGDQVTARQNLEQGRLIAPLDETVPAIHDMYIACRSEARDLPQVGSFIDWITEEMHRPS